VLQVLLYPGLDLVGRRPSRDLFAEGFVLTEHDIIWYRDHYTPDPAIRSDPLVSPLLAPDLTGLAPAYIVTAGFDPLRDEGIEYADALITARVPVTDSPCSPHQPLEVSPESQLTHRSESIRTGPQPAEPRAWGVAASTSAHGNLAAPADDWSLEVQAGPYWTSSAAVVKPSEA
jgi:acetyl esterase/lipase